jgi:hypothetical protein
MPASANIAHISLRGKIHGMPFTDGEMLSVTAPLVDLLDGPDGARSRQLPFGTDFCAVDRAQDRVFGFAVDDGYCGWLPADAVGNLPAASHWVASSGTHLYPKPRVQAPQICALPMGAKVRVTGQEGSFARTDQGYVPQIHLRKLGAYLDDPAAVATGLLGAPYLWGGNSREGLDCSGLVQMSLRACGVSAAADSDLQQTIGRAIPENTALMRGDLVFWKGHVAMVLDNAQLIHANGHSMSVAIEGIAACVARIADMGGGPVTARRRPR